MKYWGKLGAFWGGFWGLLFGSAFFWVPGVGPLLVAGPLAMSIVGALEGAVVTGGFTALGAALYSIGIPKDSILQYETEIKNDKLLLFAHGTAEEVQRTKDLLHQTQSQSLSYAYLMEELARLGDPAATKGRVILAHLGNGASLAAVRDGKRKELTA